MPKQQRKERKTPKFMNFQQRRKQSLCLLQCGNNPDRRRKVKLAGRISYLLAKLQVLRNPQGTQVFHIILLVQHLFFTTK